MVKHTETIRRQQPMNCLSVFDYFVGLARQGLILEVKLYDDPQFVSILEQPHIEISLKKTNSKEKLKSQTTH